MSGFGGHGWGTHGFGAGGSGSTTTSDPQAGYISDICAVALGLLHEQHKNQPKIEAFLCALLRPFQILEDSMNAMLEGMGIDNAIGAQLDLIGKKVLYPRNGMTDDVYRPRLKVRIAQLSSDGSIESMIAVIDLLIGDTVTWQIDERFPAGVALILSGSVLDTDLLGAVVDFGRLSKAAGVNFVVEYNTVPDAETFTFGSVTELAEAGSISDTTITVDSTWGFPQSGSILLDLTGAGEEQCTYTSKDSTKFYGVSPLTNAHSIGVTVQSGHDSIRGLEDVDSGIGGVLGGVV